MEKCKPVIVLAGTAIGSVLSLCKNGTLSGHKMFVVCTDRRSCACYQTSKYINQVYQVSEFTLYIVCHNIYLKENAGKPLLYSTADIYCIWVNRQRSEFEQIAELCIPSYEIISKFCFKNTANDEARRNGLLVPKCIIVKTEEDIQTVEKSFHFPIIIKPVSVEVSQSIGYKYQIIEKKEFVSNRNILFEQRYEKLICQEYIPGDDSSYMFYLFFRDDNGNIAECMGEKTVQTNGIMTIGTTKFDRNLSEIARTFLRNINYIGIGGLEFKRYNEQYYFIEMSTRTEGFLQISDMAGISCADASFQWYTYRNDAYKHRSQKQEVRYVTLMGILLNIIRKKSIQPLFHYVGNLLFDKQTYIAEFYTERRPYKASVKQLIKKKLNLSWK